ncbi:MAG: hydrogenase nickel incorporation protein HypB [Desulfobulbaceae bacterium]|nr:hydrogenase nickel incorporation protein HypB [Desulfobulbaceae bacterium]MCK5403751.1 hydrogenase nickel incorporation protein HypB [Desulfobulbaceae bacterium]
MKVTVVKNILAANDIIAQKNRELFDTNKVFAFNLMSSPGAGKTTLIEEMGKALQGKINIGVIEGDIQSTIDAERVAQTGITAVQIETAGACHLDANMIRSSLNDLDLAPLDILVIENVGNLVCPAEFNVGEHKKVMLLSVTEGDDKPLKYPLMFQESQVLLISKIDLLPHVRCDVGRIREAALSLNSDIKIIEVSAYTGRGLPEWHEWLMQNVSTG